MRLFVCEFITGGGMQDADLPPELAREGDIMLTALLSDLLDAGYDNIICSRDPRLEKIDAEVQIISPGKNAWKTWDKYLGRCDAAWLIAPETGDVLYELARLATGHDCLLIGCTPEAVRLTASKSKTIEYLLHNQIPVVPAWKDPAQISDNSNSWVIKPDDGVGGEGCYFFDELASLHQHINQFNHKNYIVQEYIPGIPASISMLCYRRQALVLGCNEQLFAFENGKGHLSGVVVNGLRQHQPAFEKIAADIAGVLDGLTGYIGIDLIVTEQGPVVVEINPRLTTAYAGLHQSLGQNPAGMILSLLQTGRFPDLYEVKYQPVTVRF